ncbi:N-terminal domain of NEFA-interacting nuclear protein NIP30-domain-containing protein [Echria macrotheca]|uniref:N-terminal domain of NEFA-interacting nuclear protein NIP30-domain-containing protein n=1 Tax=Echria macrotheca TaxID=438768 RepID=A0AAJ0FC63_9PEZI|nr:N-terminal domain of NEFA-interacting nuclear protein NIP30-domain-containing protein [Echria macrotheca]
MSRFISAGAIDATTGEPSSTTSTTPPTSTTSTSSTKKSQEWEQVQAQLAAARAGRAASEKRGGGGEPERSLYDVLQANKAAKQAAFEEASRLRNQFRALDDDEIEFLEGVRRRQREEEEREEEEEEEEKKKKGDGDGDGGEDGKGRVVVEEGKAVEKAEGSKVTKADGKDKVEQPAVVAGGTMKKLGGLVAYGSSDEDDDY